MILAGEIGATKTRLAAFENEGNRLNTVVEKTYLSQQESSLPNIISELREDRRHPGAQRVFRRGRTRTRKDMQDLKPGLDD